MIGFSFMYGKLGQKIIILLDAKTYHLSVFEKNKYKAPQTLHFFVRSWSDINVVGQIQFHRTISTHPKSSFTVH